MRVFSAAGSVFGTVARSMRPSAATLCQPNAPFGANTSAVCSGEPVTSARYALSPVVSYSSAAAQ